MKSDEFDKLVSDGKITDDEWKAFAKILKIKDILSIKENGRRCLIVNKEFRHYFGNTLVNFFRDEYSPDYEDILQATMVCLGISEDSYPSDMSILEKEDLITKKIVEDKILNVDTGEFVESIIEIADSKVSMVRQIIDGLKGGVLVVFAKSWGFWGVFAGVVNKLLLDTNWKIVLSVIMLTCCIRKRLVIMEGLSRVSDKD